MEYRADTDRSAGAAPDDIGGHVLRLFFSDVEGDHANRVLILACEQVENDGFGPASQWEMMMVETSRSAKMPAKGMVKKHTRLKTILGGADRLDKAQQGIRGVHGGEKARDEEKGGQEI
jgi:hypothetical protein